MPVSTIGTNGLTSGLGVTASTLSVNGNNISAVNSLGFRNRIINGNMVIDQRNAGASVTPTATVYTLDRWQLPIAQASKLSIQQNAGAVTPPAGFSNYLGLTSLSAYSITSTDYFLLTQAVEGYNIADLAWGTASAQSVTLSFWVRSSLTGTFGGVVTNGTRAYPFTYSISAANTWEYKTVVVPGDTSGTWATNNTTGLIVQFGLGVGANRSGTAGAWATGTINSATGAVSVVGTNGATFYITGVQLEAGSVATPFEQIDYGRELIMCQRYFARVFDPAMRGTGTGGTAGGASRLALFFPQTMRAAPTASISGTFAFWNGAATATGTVLAGYFQGGNNSLDMDINTSASFTIGQAVCAYCQGSTTKYVDLNSEL
jgi:hypothetical protein